MARTKQTARKSKGGSFAFGRPASRRLEGDDKIGPSYENDFDTLQEVSCILIYILFFYYFYSKFESFIVILIWDVL